MIYDLQKGSLLKRASAFLLDGIILVILVTGFAFALSGIFHYGTYADRYSAGMDYYAKQYNVDFDSIVTEADYNALSDQEKQNYEAVIDAMNNDPELLHALNMIVSIIVLVVSISTVLAFAVVEFILPLILKNGQTVGKKIFGLAVMRVNGVRIRTVSLFIRTFLGKYVIETMIPVLIALMIIFNAIGIMGGPGIMGLIFVGLLLIGQVLLLCFTKTKSMIHDIISDCVVVDMASQLIFDDEQSMLQYKAQKSAEIAAKSPY